MTGLSDFEINKLVAEHIGITPDNIFDKENVVFKPVGNDNFEKFDPCNKPEHAMPTIIENGISLIFQDRKFHYASNDGEMECFIDNPYKAAMVIFLHIKDMENEI
ncbi:phage protein NinX family protein [Xenorhabdus hominickii]|uniref:Uncharacterized protein n=1 Tax=Xenorhabdus hominickii TaxID=351679 RepID=A0A2G0PMQ4_XENHO|nr:phage protein NinX family protein [Xenorhabdus hominickii]AOM39571.1 hypothetical protein A9255_02540 [Xenorhabdus hominickii]PHM48245.1 hypothetical protein Xhom_05039 [Xenorhabdus hominickii]